MKTLLSFSTLLLFVFANTQPFSGVWRGTITRDYGNEITTDSIEFNLQQHGDTLTGYSMLYQSRGVYIRAAVKGFYNENNNTLRLTETNIDNDNLSGRDEKIFLDIYLLSFSENDRLELTGKSVSRERKPVYTRSKIVLKKFNAEDQDSRKPPSLSHLIFSSRSR